MGDGAEAPSILAGGSFRVRFACSNSSRTSSIRRTSKDATELMVRH